MQRAAKDFEEDTKILTSLFCWGGFGIKIIADKTLYGIYSLYGCDEDGHIHVKHPLCIGNADEIISYLNDKNNINDVSRQICITDKS